MWAYIYLYKYIDKNKNIYHGFHTYIISYHDIMQWTEGIRMDAEEVQFPVLLKFQECLVLPTWSLGRSDIVMWGRPFFCSDWTCSVLRRYFLFPIYLIHYSQFLLHCIISHSFTIFIKTVYPNSSFSLFCQLLAGEGWGGPSYLVADKRPLTMTTLYYVVYSNE